MTEETDDLTIAANAKNIGHNLPKLPPFKIANEPNDVNLLLGTQASYARTPQ